MNYLIETFDQTTGKRYYYNHQEDKHTAMRSFLRIQSDIFKEIGGDNQIVCLIEVIGMRPGMMNEGVGSMSISRVMAVKGLNVPPSKLSLIGISERVGGNPFNYEPSIYLRQIA